MAFPSGINHNGLPGVVLYGHAHPPPRQPSNLGRKLAHKGTVGRQTNTVTTPPPDLPPIEDITTA